MNDEVNLQARISERLFTEARTFNQWQATPLSEAQLRELYALTRMGPTSANCCPARFRFVVSSEGKARLKPALSSGNLDKTMSAPLTVIVGYDTAFFEALPRLFPHADARSWFTSSPELAQETAFRNGSLQGAYLILAARTMGLDAGPISGFDSARVDEEYFAGTSVRTNFIVNVGYGDPTGNFERLPRLSFEEAVQVI